MSVAAVMLVRDEADVIEYTIRHLCAHVDEVIVADNLSEDGTTEILRDLAIDLPVLIVKDAEVAYFQSRKTSTLARAALSRGHAWVVPCDADEVWYAPDGRRLADYLAGVGADAQIVTADLFNHWPTSLDDPAEGNPFRRLAWRSRERAPLPKVAARLAPDLTIDQGNHAARYGRPALAVSGLAIRHFSWRTADQYTKKIRNGEQAYKATDLPDGVGAHWRMFEGAEDDAIRDHFQRWFFVEDPEANDELVNDPAPIAA